jgi:uncharacterized membrane protein YdjX (TVP38/TMEM64 family)
MADAGAAPGAAPELERRLGARVSRHAPMAQLRRFLPLAILLLAIVAAFGLGLADYISFEQLERHRAQLLDFVDRRPLLAPLAFMLIYAAVVALSIPGGAVLTMAGGFLFGVVAGTCYVVVAATIGATIVFLVARTALGDSLRRKAGPGVRRMEAGFRENALNYLLFLRLIPVFPFWLVNLVPAFLGVPLPTYMIATFLGIIPGSLVYASVGHGLGTVFDAGGTPDLGIVFEPEIILPMIGLAVLAILPVAYKKIRARQAT